MGYLLLRHAPRAVLIVVSAYVMTLGGTFAALAFDRVEQIDKVKPVFAVHDGSTTAKLIPKGKSTSILIDFKADIGNLVAVKGVDFKRYARPEVDGKNFKSELFEIEVEGVPVGAEVRVSLSSDFFTSSTAFYIYNAGRQKPWMNPPESPPVENIAHPGLVRELVITVRDGGDYDSDGAADGRITLIGGPRDSFWGYALGTLFIRFFGIFIVLGVLQIGMQLSGLLFRRFESASVKAVSVVEPESEQVELSEVDQPMLTAEIAAAIAVALALETGEGAGRPGAVIRAGSSASAGERSCRGDSTSAWAQQGRVRLMEERLSVFKRQQHFERRG